MPAWERNVGSSEPSRSAQRSPARGRPERVSAQPSAGSGLRAYVPKFARSIPSTPGRAAGLQLRATCDYKSRKVASTASTI
jgi:hypothetical protein